MQNAAAELRNVSLTAGAATILQDVTLTIASGDALSVIGPSGAGKTTVLRLLNRLVIPTAGEVRRNGQPLSAANEIAVRRDTGYVPQGAALFPHRTVLQNIATVPRLLGWDAGRTASAARELLDSLGLPFARYAERFPRSLSGGEQQRVAIARALITAPSLLLCDEPFAALDPLVRREQQDAFIASWRDRRTTLVFVTHDVHEALRIGRRIVLVDRGTIAFDGSGDEFRESALPLARRFLDSAGAA